MTTDRERDARLACRWFGWQWWKDIPRGRCAIVPPEDNRMGWPTETHVEMYYRRCKSVPPPEQRFTDWHRCWCDKPLPHFDSDGNAMLSLLAKLESAGWFLRLTYRHECYCLVWFVDEHGCDHSDGVECKSASLLPEAVAAAADMIPEGK